MDELLDCFGEFELSRFSLLLQQGPGWLELSEMTDQPDYDLETFVNKAEFALAQQAKHFSSLRGGCCCCSQHRQCCWPAGNGSFV